MRLILKAVVGLIVSSSAMCGTAQAEDGYDLWLRYRALPPANQAAMLASASAIVVPSAASPTIAVAASELHRGLAGLVGRDPETGAFASNGAIVIGTPATSSILARLHLPLARLSSEGYLVRSVQSGGISFTVVAANSDAGVLYGTFALLRHLQTGGNMHGINEVSAPKLKLRLLDHWDNLDRSVERGYAGLSIWDWNNLPFHTDPRYIDYARANASIGINGVVLNNVNAKPESLTAPWIAKAAKIADAIRPYHMKVYLSARFDLPIAIGGLKTADPLDPAVIRFWHDKADEIYHAIPDFGGFLVKASSEGQPGPGDYHRTHADGANMMAAALAPHGGTVIWRAFVYAANGKEDRIKQAYTEFKPLDGKFAKNVLIQVKNGPLDFQPREPFHPLFGAMPRTPLMFEGQITKEYLGQDTHLVYLGAYWEEVLKSDTFARGRGTTVASVIEQGPLTGAAGIANIGNSRNWTGSIFNQANWYAFGRLAWDPGASSRDIAAEWTRMTFSTDPSFVNPVVAMMMRSREAVVDYMEPLGLAHIMAAPHHYGPGPWTTGGREDWTALYYHRADATGIGRDRTGTGENALSQYTPEAAKWLSSDTRFLLWFNHVRWDAPVEGTTLWSDLVRHYDHGVADAAAMRRTWNDLSRFVDPERFRLTADFLEIQDNEAHWWRDACLSYFSAVSGRPLPDGVVKPQHNLQYYQSLHFPYRPG
jgi:alpha-glucuronidase